MRPLLLLVGLLFGSGCVPDLPGGTLAWADELTRAGGCGDVVLFAVNVDDDLMLRFDAEDLVALAEEAGSEQVFTFVFPTGEATLELTEGDQVSDATCDDVIMNGGPDVDRSWLAVEGEAVLTVTPSGEAGTRATLELTDVLLEDDAGVQAGLESFTIADVSVGWLPG